MSEPIFNGPTFAEMLDPTLLPENLRQEALAARSRDPLDPINLYNITWKNEEGGVHHIVLPKALTGVAANIVVLLGSPFPTGSHKVGAAYSILREHQLAGTIDPAKHTLIFPSTGNFGIGGAWVGPRMGYRSTVVLPEEMSEERFEKIRGYGAEVIATPGCESNVKEIYDKVRELRRDPQNRILNQFEEFGNYHFHYFVTGGSVLDLTASLAAKGCGNGRVAAFVSAMGSAGTIAAGDKLKQHFSECQIVGVEPIQCPTLYNVGYGGHRIEGIGDKHVTWIHNVMNMDWLLCIDDLASLKGLQLVEEGGEILAEVLSIDPEELRGRFGISSICNILAAIKTAKLLDLSPEENIVTVATDGFDRYPSVMRRLDAEIGPMTRNEALRRIEIFHGATLDHVLEGTRQVRRRWHNQKYFTWVEQQGKSVEELNALADPAFWLSEQARIEEIDRAWRQRRDGV